MTTPAFPSYAGHRFPAEVISYAVWLYFRLPLNLRILQLAEVAVPQRVFAEILLLIARLRATPAPA